MADTPGADLFLRGAGAQIVIGAGEGAVRLPADRFACAGCHGADGAGRAEGGTEFPDIRWSRLASRYDDVALLRVLRDGVAADGGPLGAAMPRYDAPDHVLVSLLDYLHGLEAAQTAITPDAIRIQASGDPALDQGFAAAAQRFNQDGGAFGRRLILVPDGSDIVLADLEAAMAPEIARTCLEASLNAMRSAGVARYRLIGADGDEVAYRAGSIGLTQDATARDVLVLAPLAPAGVVPQQHYYGCVDAVGPVIQDLVAQGSRVTAAVPDIEGFAWALSTGKDWQAMNGYTLGRLMGQAARAAGRRVTGTGLTDTARKLHLPVETVSFPP